VQMVNAAISGTGSHVGLFRLSEHVLPYKPDLVFIEFAVNDKGIARKDPELSISCMEQIVRTLKACNPQVAVTFVYAAHRSGNVMDVHHTVAEHYGLPEIDLYTPLLKQIEDGSATWDDFLQDSAHPNDTGHAVYAQQVADTVLQDPARFLAPVPEREPIGRITFRHPHIVYVRDLALSHCSGFSLQPIEDWTDLKRLPELVIHECLISDRLGDSFTFEFEGAHLGIYHRIGNASGRFSLTVDGELRGEINTCHVYTPPIVNGEVVSSFRLHSLSAGRHTATITVIEPSEKSTGTNVAIAGIIVD